MSVMQMDPLAFGRTTIGGAGRSREVATAAEDCLRRSAYREFRGVVSDYHEGVLVLRGRVSSYYLKQVAQTLLGEVDGVVAIDNQLEVIVRRPSGRAR